MRIRKTRKHLFNKPKMKKSLGGDRRGWEDNIKTNLKEIGCVENGVDLAGLGQGPLSGLCDHSNEYSGSIQA
jgi:hypothetical protein